MSSSELQCPGRQEPLAAMVDGQLPPEEQADLIDHMSDCETCYKLYTELLLVGEDDDQDVEPAPVAKAAKAAKAEKAEKAEKATKTTKATKAAKATKTTKTTKAAKAAPAVEEAPAVPQEIPPRSRWAAAAAKLVGMFRRRGSDD